LGLPAGAAKGRADAPAGKLSAAQGAAIRVAILAVWAAVERRRRRRTARIAAQSNRKEE